MKTSKRMKTWSRAVVLCGLFVLAINKFDLLHTARFHMITTQVIEGRYVIGRWPRDMQELDRAYRSLPHPTRATTQKYDSVDLIVLDSDRCKVIARTVNLIGWPYEDVTVLAWDRETELRASKSIQSRLDGKLPPFPLIAPNTNEPVHGGSPQKRAAEGNLWFK